MELDVRLPPRLVDEAEGVHAKAGHGAVVARDAHVVQQERQHVAALGVVGQEVHAAPVLLLVVLGVGLERVHQVRELHAVTDEEHRHVVAHQVKVALARIELDGKAARVAQRLGAAALVRDGGEARDDGRLHAGRAQEVGAREMAHVVRHLEKALGHHAARVHDALGDALAVKLRQLLHQVVVLQQDGAARAHRERRVVVPHGCAAVGGPVHAVGRGRGTELVGIHGCCLLAKLRPHAFK
mmetsp:Transcript_15125/g.37689  ORF Transcript_15125/g.37689 Transcript_15125/m.37689 type:complete len:240 (+) Transcript_15125:1588-2307(+)